MAILRFVIDGELINEREWEIRIYPETLEHAPIHTRRLQRSALGFMAFPQPPQSEAQAISDAALHKHLCTTSAVGDILSVYLNIIQRDPETSKKDIETFARYLASTLLNQTAWEAIDAIAQDQPIELALCSHAGMHELARLPWEMMYGINNFLVAETRRPVAITRLITEMDQAHKQADLDQLASPLKVLFVVGNDLSDVRIRPGAEYLSLLRRLEAQGILNFQSRILLAATGQDLEDEVKRWRPAVVHFICHGGYDEQKGGFLELMPEDEREPNPRFFAPALLPRLTPHNLRPLVVLNACYTGMATTLAYAPLAVELVQGGLPIVVAMVGSVADRACRLFTRRFYEALLTGESIVEATAQGRRAGFVELNGHQTNVDWIFPTLFLAEGISPSITVDTQSQEDWLNLQRIANKYYNVRNLPVFCDRLVFIEAYEHLINSSDDSTGLKVLAIEARPADTLSQERRPKYGKTRLLQELAARAVRDGHIPCLLADPEAPSTPFAVGQKLLQAITQAYQHFDLPLPIDKEGFLTYEFFLLKKVGQDPQAFAILNPLLRQTLQLHETAFDHLAVIAAALRVDLRNLANTARERYPDAKVLLLVDDVHAFGVAPADRSALDLFLRHLLIADGLLHPGDPIRVIFTYSKVMESEYRPAVSILTDYVQNTQGFLRYLPLEAFRGPEDPRRHECFQDEYHLAYQQFLLYHNLVIPHGVKPEKRELVYKHLHEVIQGIPSRLRAPNEALETALSIFQSVQFLEVADDEEILQQLERPRK